MTIRSLGPKRLSATLLLFSVLGLLLTHGLSQCLLPARALASRGPFMLDLPGL